MNHASCAPTTTVQDSLVTHMLRDSFHRAVLHELKKRDRRYRFKHRVTVQGVLVDFYCHELRLVILFIPTCAHEYELYKHVLSSHGYRVAGFTHDHVLDEHTRVSDKIFFLCLHLSSY